MATFRQIAANRRNAQLSTGPISDEGKDAARRNALKHGLAGAGTLLPDADLDAVQQRKLQWRPYYQPETPEQEWLFEQIVVNSVRLDRCHQQEEVLRSDLTRRAALCWDDDRRLDAETLAARLGHRPALISRQLQHTRQGVELMIDRWRALDALHDRNGAWSEAQIALALDLLGQSPDLRDESPPALEDPRALVAREIARLEQRQAQALDALDELERSAAARGIEIHTSPALKTLRRYEAACLRNYLRAEDQFRQQRPITPPASPPPLPPDDDANPEADDPLTSSPATPAHSLTDLLPPASANYSGNRHARRAAAKQARQRCA